MLEGFDKDWVECGESNFTNYSNLSGDDYVFKVRATDRKGNWMESFAKPLLQTKNIAFDFSYDPALLQVNLSMEQRKNFYLVFKEAINNVLKYSVAGHLEVKIKTGNHKVSLTAKDDGVGFDTAQMKVLAAKSLSGNGLFNMKRRATEMKGECFIESDPGEGTTVHLNFPIE